MLSCIKYKKLLLPYAEDALDAPLKSKLEAHIAGCPGCSQELAELMVVSHTLRQADVPAVEPASDLWMRVQSAITEPAERRRPWWQLPSYQAASALGAASILLFAVLAVHSPVHYDETASLKKTPVETRQLEPHQSKVTQVERKDSAAPASKPVADNKTAESSKPAGVIFYKGPVRRAGSSYISEKPASAPASEVLSKRRTSISGRITSQPIEGIGGKRAKTDNPQRLYSLDHSDGDTYHAVPETTIAPEAKGAKSPVTQAGRIPGGSQVPAQPGLPFMASQPQPDKSGEPEWYNSAADAAPAKSLEREGKSAVSLGNSTVSEADNPSAGVRVAAAPSAAAGSPTNIADPPLLGDKAEADRLRKPVPSATFQDKMAYRTTVTPTEESIRADEGILKSKPGDVKTMRKLSDAYKAKGLSAKHMDMLEKISKAEPDDAANWLELGKAYEQAGNKDKARNALKKAAAKGNNQIKKEAEAHLQKLDAKK